jgi:prepilin-type N-terminal cleavage/methylation domain-containing protein
MRHRFLQTSRETGCSTASGFTLVELLVAVAITGMLSLAIYALFSSTSDAMQEADSLVNTVNRSRFAMERLRSDIRNAGSFGTPDSTEDPWVEPSPNPIRSNPLQVAGLVSYGGGSGWQDDVSLLQNAGLLSDNEYTGGSTTLRPSFDGIVVIGAYGLPGSFEISNIRQNATQASIYATQRGLVKLRRNDPLDTTIETYDFSKDDNMEPIVRPHGGTLGSGTENAVANSILRIQDPQGYFQFTGVQNAAPGQGSGRVGTQNFLDLTFTSPLYQQRDATNVPSQVGLQPQHDRSGGRSYQASLLDVFWYHVRRDPKNPRNFMLVRERLDGASVAQALGGGNWNGFNPANNRAYGADDYVVITDRVVDFQFWVDCAQNTSGSGNLEQAAWLRRWATPPTTMPDNQQGIVSYDCLDPADPEPGRARVAHVRLSLRTATERSEQRHLDSGFPNPGGSGERRMRTFDLRPEAEGAASVYTAQMDIELTNFTMRNIRYD